LTYTLSLHDALPICHDPFTNPKHAAGAVKIALALPSCDQKTILLQEIMTYRHVKDTTPIQAELDRVSKGDRNPEPDPEPSVSSNEETGTVVPQVDPVKVLFDSGIHLLALAGLSAAKARPLIGKWRSAHGTEAVIVALGRAQREGAIDPVAFVEGCFRAKAKSLQPVIGDQRTSATGKTSEYAGAVDGWMEIRE
jgi:hypothetical protein